MIRRSKRTAKKNSELEISDEQPTKSVEIISNECLSNYELIRLENIRRNEIFVCSLGVDSFRNEINAVIPQEIKQKQVKKQKKSISHLDIRRSSRLTVEKVDIEINENILSSKIQQNDLKGANYDDRNRICSQPLSLLSILNFVRVSKF